MRLPSDARAFETIAAAAAAGITVFDTARAYDGNEQLLARALRACGADTTARIVTKAGMSRAAGGWVPDGRAKTIRSDCEASLAALDGLPIDLLLIHAPDQRTPWRTSVRALARLADEGLVRRVGVANVNRGQLDEALELAPVAAVQVGLSLVDDRALRGGVVGRCAEAGIALIAHSPLGGPRRVRGLLRRDVLLEVAERRGATSAEVALAWLLALAPVVIPIPGARRPETARSAARASAVDLTEGDTAALARVFAAPQRPQRRRAAEGDVVLVMGIPGAGKSRIAEEYVPRGYARLNRDERGGSLRDLAAALDEELASGSRRIVLDNTYLTRASRSYVLEAAARHGLPVRCVWLDTPLAQAQVNLVARLLERFGGLPAPEELREAARREPGLHTPTSQMRTVRELEPPSPDEGFAAVEQVAFARAPGRGRPGVFVAAAAVQAGWEPTDPAAPHLLFDWRPDGSADELAVHLKGVAVEVRVCPHPGGPPVCWCRPPLPGLALAFAKTHGVDPAQSTVVGTSPAHRTLATTLGARYVAR